jgi:hypothetical protein
MDSKYISPLALNCRPQNLYNCRRMSLFLFLRSSVFPVCAPLFASLNITNHNHQMIPLRMLTSTLCRCRCSWSCLMSELCELYMFLFRLFPNHRMFLFLVVSLSDYLPFFVTNNHTVVPFGCIFPYPSYFQLAPVIFIFCYGCCFVIRILVLFCHPIYRCKRFSLSLLSISYCY